MNSEQREKLNEICEANGFKILEESSRMFVIEPVDIWEGVRYAECVDVGFYIDDFTNGKIYKLRDGKNINSHEAFIDDQGGINGFSPKNKDHFKPSTEEDYKQQLIKEAKERYGEIKDGDKFNQPNGITHSILLKSESRIFDYYEKYDQLNLNGFILYKKGKWAERVEKVRVTRIEIENNYINAYIDGVNCLHIDSEKTDKIRSFINQTLNE